MEGFVSDKEEEADLITRARQSENMGGSDLDVKRVLEVFISR